MSVVQIIAISLFVCLGSIGSIVGNTIGWYTLGRPLVASLMVDAIVGDLQTAMIMGIALQIIYMDNVIPDSAVAWDLSYATYISTAGALVFGTGMESTQVIGLAVVFAGIDGLVGQMVWNLSYALNLSLSHLANGYTGAGETGKMYTPNIVCGQLIGLTCRLVPAVILLITMTVAPTQADFAFMIPGWLITLLSTFGGMVAALGMGVVISFLLRKQWQICIFLLDFILVTYFNLNTMAVAVITTLLTVIYYVFQIEQKEARTWAGS